MLGHADPTPVVVVMPLLDVLVGLDRSEQETREVCVPPRLLPRELSPFPCLAVSKDAEDGAREVAAEVALRRPR